MSVIKVENLTFSYPSSDDMIFEGVNFQIDTAWKLGFIGRNGKGKTTFFKLLQGQLDYRGKITSSVKFDYFPYKVKDKSMLTGDILNGICPEAEEWEFLREFSFLDIDCGVLYRPFNTLSNGEQTKALLAALFLNEGHFLLIDEPTNHLDAKARKVVAEYLQKKKSFILVSHDRSFLDSCVDHILSFNKTNIEVQSGSFSSFMVNFERQQEFEKKQSARLQSDIVRLREAARQTSEWSDRVEATKYGTKNSGLRPDRGFIGHKSAKMMKRAKCVEARQNKEIEQKASLLKNMELSEALKISPVAYHSERLAAFTSVALKYDGKEICRPVTFEINRGDRIALDGKNGSGKSSLIKLICGEDISYSGTVKIGQGVIISYVPQDTSYLSGRLDEFARVHGLDVSLFIAILHKMGLDKKQYDKDISNFSEGQKKKTLIAKSLCEKAHLYVWDEPLNFIDIFSRMQIEALLTEFKPTMIFVEHDKAFKDKIANKTVCFNS